MSRFRRRAAPTALAGALLLAVLLLPLALGGGLLTSRDIPLFHLPLRTVARQLALQPAIPQWNPLLHGGQPILSNPNYAAFYPPTWIQLLLPVATSLDVLLLLHAVVAFVGAHRLLRQLGAEPDAAGLGATGFAASGWFLSLSHSFNFLCSTAWMPWVLLYGLRLLAADSPRSRTRVALFGTAVTLALQLLAGEPVAVILSGSALLCLAIANPRQLPRTLPRLLLAATLAAGIGAIQLVPTLHRLQGSVRAAGMDPRISDRWSTWPERLVDFVFPRFSGDPTGDEEGHWFGWGLHDLDFPYVLSLNSGLVLTVLAIAALIAWPIPHRRGWLLALLLGIFLAIGRHNPVWPLLRHAVPLLGIIRYPEKFLVLSTAVVPIVGALGWQHLARSRAAGERRPFLFPTALAAIAAVLAAVTATTILVVPAVAANYVQMHSGLQPSPKLVAIGVSYLQREAMVATALTIAVVVLFVLLHRSAMANSRLALLAGLLLVGDLWWYGRTFNSTLPASEVLAPPPGLQAVAHGGRVFNSTRRDTRPEINLRRGPIRFQQIWGRMQRLDPYAANVWGVGYALHDDYDLMLTPWGSYGLSVLDDVWPRREGVLRLLAAWDVGAEAVRLDPSELLAEIRRGKLPMSSSTVEPLPGRLPRFRFMTRVGYAEDRASARRFANHPAVDLASTDVCIGGDPSNVGDFAPAALLERDDRGQRVTLRYRAPQRAFVVAAITYDEGWEARIDDQTDVAICPTSLGQLGVALPAGEHRVELRYRDRWVPVGAAVTLITLLAMTLVLSRGATRERHAGAAGGPPSAAPP